MTVHFLPLSFIHSFFGQKKKKEKKNRSSLFPIGKQKEGQMKQGDCGRNQKPKNASNALHLHGSQL